MDTLRDFALTTLTTAGTSAALLLFLGWLLRTWIGERLKADLRHEYDERLERLKTELKAQSDANLALAKADIDRKAELLRVSAVSFSEVQKATITRKIQAVDEMWAAALNARSNFPVALYLCDGLTEEELASLRTDPKFDYLRSEIATIDLAKVVQLVIASAEQVRPHVGEYVWALSVTYHAIVVRYIYALTIGADAQWHRDEVTLKLIMSAFGHDAVGQFKSLPYRRFEWLRLEFERELFSSFEKLLTGISFSEAAMKQAQDMEKQLAAARRESF